MNQVFFRLHQTRGFGFECRFLKRSFRLWILNRMFELSILSNEDDDIEEYFQLNRDKRKWYIKLKSN